MNGNEYQIEEPGLSPKKLAALVGVLLAVAVLVVTLYYLTKVNKPNSSADREVNVVITKGWSTRQIADQLQQQKIISSPWLFRVYADLHGAGGKIQAGEYKLNANMAITDIVDVLTHGRVVSNARNLTVIEGWTNSQIANYLASREVISSTTDFTKSLQTGSYAFKFNDAGQKFNYQGFLFPDTYQLDKDAPVSDLVAKMLANFQSKFSDQMLADMQAKNLQIKNVIILASIIEKEVGRNQTTLTADDLQAMQKERLLVASVFYNRLKADMPLESDATVNYITGKSDRSVSILDTKIKSPYNTYQVIGLPPTPISNPGLGSIMAAIYPAQSDYLYFLNAPDGTAYFAKTLAEHNANKAKYLK